MHVQKVMDQTGHSEHAFDPKNIVSVEEAQRRFEELTSKGFRAAVKTGAGKPELVKGFDPNHEETLFIPQLVGG